MNRKMTLLLVLAICLSILLSGCQVSGTEASDISFTFSEERFEEFLLELGETARSDIENKVKRYEKSPKELEKDPLRQEYFYYHDYPLTDLQRDQLDASVKLGTSANLYVICGSRKITDDDVWIQLYQDSLSYAEKVDKNYTLLDLTNP